MVMTIDEVYRHLIFESEEERKQYKKYVSIRGIGVYSDTLKTLQILTRSNQVNFYDFMGLIRYDKNIRDHVYTYIAALEEYWRNRLCTQVDIYDFDKKTQIAKYQFGVDFGRLSSNQSYGENLYRRKTLSLGELMHLYKTAQIPLPFLCKDSNSIIEQIVSLRNLTMHHRMLTIDQTVSVPTEQSIQSHKEKVSQGLDALITALPKEYREGFLHDLAKSNIDKQKKRKKSIFLNYDEVGGVDRGIPMGNQSGE
jgi:hypothetical protein